MSENVENAELSEIPVDENPPPEEQIFEVYDWNTSLICRVDRSGDEGEATSRFSSSSLAKAMSIVCVSSSSSVNRCRV